jgi:phosphate transport system protein
MSPAGRAEHNGEKIERMERHHFEADLQALRNQLLTMGGLVEERVHRAVDALIHRREEEAQRIIATDKEVNDLQIDIDNRCLKLLATQTPLAVDLRLITSAMKINADLERVGDQAVNIAENVLVLLPQPPLKPLIDIPRMAAIAEKMVRDALDAFVKRDAELARDVLRRDDEVDGLKDQLFRELLTYMMADPGTIQRALALILISRNLERIADHATNIAEDVIFIAEAKDVRHHAEQEAEKP